MSEFAEETPRALEQMNFLHMELNPEQQSVLEHTYGMHGRLPVETNEDLAKVLNMTPQKVRAIKRQIAKRYEKRYR
jgi:DNA-directed RNA polymerase sigma subunit (sigma70/sigma32)